MRIESSVTSVSWIPRDAIEGMVRMPFELGVAHYDLPPPDRLDDLEALIASSAIRFANVLRAVTACRVAVVPGDRIDRTALAEVARRRRDGS